MVCPYEELGTHGISIGSDGASADEEEVNVALDIKRFVSKRGGQLGEQLFALRMGELIAH
jgi:hypothetical protein